MDGLGLLKPWWDTILESKSAEHRGYDQQSGVDVAPVNVGR